MRERGEGERDIERARGEEGGRGEGERDIERARGGGERGDLLVK